MDRDADGTASAAERAAYAAATCQRFADSLRIDVDGTALTWRVTGSHVSYEAGAAGLATGRTECRLTTAPRRYRDDLLTSPVDDRDVQLRTGPGHGTTSGSQATPPGAATGMLAAFGDRLHRIVGSDHVTPLVGVLSVLPALMLGAGHATLPGHGKTVMAAYIAGRNGTYRDAVTVAATVTHTGGVLVIGIVLTAASSLAGEAMLGWLAVVSRVLGRTWT